MTIDLQSPRLPEGICIGASKCATTSLHYYLKAHPQVGVQPRKEMRFFADVGTWDKGVEWYKRQFPTGKQCLVESFGGYYTAYPKEPEVPARIHSLIPQACLIYMVRDPIDRMISRYVHNYSELKEHRSAEEALGDLADVEYVPQSMYFAQLERYFPYFSPDQFLIVDDGDFMHDRSAILRRIFEFLGVQPDFWSAEFDVIRHPSSQKRRLTKLGIVFHERVGQHVLRHLYGHQDHIFRKIFYTPISNAIPRPTLSKTLRAQLREIFKPDVTKLEDFTGRKFTDWLQAS
jgi:Sulfotransferase family